MKVLHIIQNEENKWVEYYPFIDKVNWSDIYMILHKTSKDRQLHNKTNCIGLQDAILTLVSGMR